MTTIFKREAEEDSAQGQGSLSDSSVLMPGLRLPAGPLQGGRRVSGCGVAAAEVSAPGVFVGLTFSFCEMGTNLPLWQAAVRELTQT